MQEKTKKKINYRIITAEDLLKEIKVETKELVSEPERKLNIETEKKETEKEIKEEIKEKETPAEIEKYIIEKEPEIKIEEKVEIKEDTEEFKEKPLSEKKNIFKNILNIFDLSLWTEKIKISKKVFLGSIVGLITIFVGIFVFSVLKKQSTKPEKTLTSNSTTTSTATSAPSLSLIFPSSTQTQQDLLYAPPQATETFLDIPKPIQTSTTTSTSIPITLEKSIPEGIIPLKNIVSRNISLKDSSYFEFEKELKQLITEQETANTIVLFNLVFNDKPVPVNYFLNYFFKPKNFSSTEIENFKNNIENQYAFVMYYSYTRKNPIFIFKVKDINKAKEFNQKWEEKNMAEDLKTLFFNFDPGNPIENFKSKKIGKVTYRIVNFRNNYQLIWLIYKNYLIYSTSEKSLAKIISSLK